MKDETQSLIDKATSQNQIVSYSTMREGKRGHFVRLGFLASPVNSFHDWVEVDGDSLKASLELAMSLVEMTETK